MKTKQIIISTIVIIFLILLTIAYNTFPIMCMPDSVEYYNYLKIFYGQESMAHWDIVRGFTLPTILYIITLIFGNSSRGLVIGTFIFYMVTIILAWIILQKIDFKSKFIKIISYIIYIAFIVLNPMIIGYMHCLLTEFTAFPILFISTIISMKWIKKGKTWISVLMSMMLIIGTVLTWFLKQPYVFLMLGPIIVAAVISIFEDKKLKNLLYRISIVILCIIFILLSSKIWNIYLIKNGVNMETKRDTNSFIKSAIINGNTMFSIDFYESHYTEEYIFQSDLISEENKSEIRKILNDESQYKSYKLVNVFNNFSGREEENIKEKLVMFSKHQEYGIMDSMKMYCYIVVHYPAKTIISYATNYLTIADVVATKRHKDANEYYPSLIDEMYYENKSIGYGMYNNDKNTLWINSDNNDIDALRENNRVAPQIRENIIETFDVFNGAYIILTLLLPVLLILIIRKRVILKNAKNKLSLNIGITLIGASFIHMIFHTVTGAVIDRYGFVIFPAIIIGIIILLSSDNTNNKINEENKDRSKKMKPLVIIPAYNEALNIEKTITDLKEHCNYDYVIINDCSKDNTKEICEKNKYNLISLPINYGLTSAIQIGMKYAKRNNYDIAIQFDGDGQHKAEYLNTLVEKMIADKSDVVIGSRFVTEKKPFSKRMIGSRLIATAIKLVTGQTIKDPTAGMRAYNSAAIEEFVNNASLTPEPDTLVYLIKKGMKVEEVQVKMQEREFGESYLNPIKSIEYMFNMLFSIIFIRSLNK